MLQAVQVSGMEGIFHTAAHGDAPGSRPLELKEPLAEPECGPLPAAHQAIPPVQVWNPKLETTLKTI
jgi:hypothetical protein